MIALGFAVFIGLGALLLKLPVSTYGGISWVDALFVSVSVASVTGLSLVEFSDTFTKGMMLLRRVGSITLILALPAQQKAKGYVYLREYMAIG